MAHPVQLLSKFFVIIVLVFSCNGSVDYVYVLKSSGQVNTFKKRAEFNDNLFTGYLYGLQENGVDTLFVNFYKKGRKEGFWKKYYKSGGIKEVRSYSKGKKTGKYTGFFENGKKSFEYNFKNGEYHGLYQVWNTNGKLLRISNYKNGYEFGNQKIWYANGRIRSNYVIKDGRRYGLLGIKNCVNASESIIN